MRKCTYVHVLFPLSLTQLLHVARLHDYLLGDSSNEEKVGHEEQKLLGILLWEEERTKGAEEGLHLQEEVVQLQDQEPQRKNFFGISLSNNRPAMQWHPCSFPSCVVACIKRFPHGEPMFEEMTIVKIWSCFKDLTQSLIGRWKLWPFLGGNAQRIDYSS